MRRHKGDTATFEEPGCCYRLLRSSARTLFNQTHRCAKIAGWHTRRLEMQLSLFQDDL
jgi:hypothetical protein